MFNGPANLRKLHRRKRDKSCSKYPYFLCRKTSRNGIEPRQDLYLRCVNIRIGRDLSPLGNLSQGVFFSVDLFFRRRAPINITVTVAGNPRFHHIKTFQLFFNTLFLDNDCAIVSSRRFCQACWHFLKLALCSHPALARVKNTLSSLLKRKSLSSSFLYLFAH